MNLLAFFSIRQHGPWRGQPHQQRVAVDLLPQMMIAQLIHRVFRMEHNSSSYPVSKTPADSPCPIDFEAVALGGSNFGTRQILDALQDEFGKE